MKQSDIEFLNSLRQASGYVHLHRGKTCVIYLPGDLFLDNLALQEFAEDISHLHAFGLKIVLVMGATPQINQALENAGVSWQQQQQFRITSAPMLPILQRTLGEVRSQLEAAFSRQQPLSGHPLTLCSGNWVIAQPKGVINGIDFQYTGQTRKVNEEAIRAILDSGQVVLLTPLAYSLTGEVFNLNTLEQACSVANKLQADKLMIFTTAQQIQGLPRQLSLTDLKTFQPHNQEQAQLIDLLSEQTRQVKRIHLMNESDPTSLIIELFSRDGIGTLVFTDRYHQIRQARIEDVSGIIDLITTLEQKGMLVKRSRERLELEINNFSVIERDGHIIGCAALYPYEDQVAELACLAVDRRYQGQSLGEQLLAHLESSAKKQHLNRLFLLTTHTHHWFIEHGFVPSSLEQLPTSRQSLYNYQRQSKVLIKELT
ncbi:amino-acid N-acetyltransferase [Thiomicrospira sp. R3]|uniref:amino-acid N-acetyltransferase n=1 Tax=Thiomicrospira sp. R3 TaxID=3035472 RepID=UPI00259BEC2F|nr:amino-acid N-acetyltransferase [Thiomicrospira sp. R3]WFE69141.1 amino-acid N-acetyltransferase [Thiomicrospira sp. R3]